MSLRLLLDDPRQSVQIGQVEDLNFWFIERPAKEWREDDEKKIQALLARMTELHAKNLPICDPVYVARKPGPKRPGDDSTHWVLIGDLRVEAAWRLGKTQGSGFGSIPVRVFTHPATAVWRNGEATHSLRPDEGGAESARNRLMLFDGIDREAPRWALRASLVVAIREEVRTQIYYKALSVHEGKRRRKRWEPLTTKQKDDLWKKAKPSLRKLQQITGFSHAEVRSLVMFQEQVYPLLEQFVRSVRLGHILDADRGELMDLCLTNSHQKHLQEELVEKVAKRLRDEDTTVPDETIRSLKVHTQAVRLELGIDTPKRPFTIDGKSGLRLRIAEGASLTEAQKAEARDALRRFGVFDEIAEVVGGDAVAVSMAEGEKVAESAKFVNQVYKNDPIPEVELVGADLTAQVLGEIDRIPSEDLPSVALAAIRAAGRQSAVRIRDLREIAWESILMLLRAVRNLGARGVR
jgi:hypothetical protein